MTNDAKLMMEYMVKETKKIGSTMYNQGIVDGFVLIRDMIKNNPEIKVEELNEVLNGFILKNTVAGENMEKKLQVVDCKIDLSTMKTATDLEDNPIEPSEDTTYHDIVSNRNYTFTNGEFIETIDDTVPETKTVISTNTEEVNTSNVSMSYKENSDISGFDIPKEFLQ